MCITTKTLRNLQDSVATSGILRAYLEYLISRFDAGASISPEWLGSEVRKSLLDLQRGRERSAGDELSLPPESVTLLVGHEWRVYEQLRELVRNSVDDLLPLSFSSAFGRALFQA